jgi:hypothetical protein
MKKPKNVAVLLAIADICIEASEAQARLLESHGKGPSKKKEDWEVKTTDQGDCKDHGYSGKQSSDQKEKGLFGILMTWKSGARFTALQDMI